MQVCRVANRHGKSLNGFHHYGRKFHDAAADLALIQRRSAPILAVLSEGVGSQIEANFASLRDPSVDHKTREEAARRLRLLIKVELAPAGEKSGQPTVPASEPVLSAAVLRGAPQYIHKILLQANGCFLEGWFDASAVMLRKLVESLIIELYERAKRAEEIKRDGEYLMLSGLVGKMLSQTHWSLGREVKQGLPELKILGDRSAHTRHYLATKADIVDIKSALRVIVNFTCSSCWIRPTMTVF